MSNIDLTKLITAEDKAAAALEAERAGMAAYRLAFEDACSLVAYGPGTIIQAIDAMRAQVPPTLGRRYDNITIFERNRPEIGAFLQNPDAINLTDEQVDDLFRLAAYLDAHGADPENPWDGGTGSLTLA